MTFTIVTQLIEQCGIQIRQVICFQRLRSMLQLCGTDPVPERPGRSEPRVVKPRPKPFPRFTRPRDEMRREAPPPKRRKDNRKPETQPRTPHKSWLL